jgi:DNA-binding CsgD family transcriptional regulator
MQTARIDFASLATPENEKKLMAAFDLANAEARVALCLADGLTIRAAAKACGFTENGARMSVKRAFVKMYVNRQHQLVRLVIFTVIEQKAA